MNSPSEIVVLLIREKKRSLTEILVIIEINIVITDENLTKFL